MIVFFKYEEVTYGSEKASTIAIDSCACRSTCLVTFAIGLLIISTTALAQNNSMDEQQPEITIVKRTIVPANATTVKANVTVIPIDNNTVLR
jgi:hypothetical protein